MPERWLWLLGTAFQIRSKHRGAMKIVRLTRHGESAANAGAATQDHTSIPLTDEGVEQARLAALSFIEPPELICSIKGLPVGRLWPPAFRSTTASPNDPAPHF